MYLYTHLYTDQETLLKGIMINFNSCIKRCVNTLLHRCPKISFDAKTQNTAVYFFKEPYLKWYTMNTFAVWVVMTSVKWTARQKYETTQCLNCNVIIIIEALKQNLI